MADACRPERAHALPALCQRTPRGRGRRPGGRDAAMESGTDRRPDQSPEEADAPEVWPGAARSSGPTLPPGGMLSAWSSTPPARLDRCFLVITRRAGSRTQDLPKPAPTIRRGSSTFITKTAQEPVLICKTPLVVGAPGVAAQRMTSSAWKRRVGGIVKPSASAVLRLMTSSNFVGCSIGRSVGFRVFYSRGR